MKKLSRRAFLQGVGGTMLSLPAMESLALAGTTKVAIPAQRLAIFYVPIGVVRSGFFPGEADSPPPAFNDNLHDDDINGAFTKVGWHDLPMTQTLSALKPVQEHVNLITGMDRVFQVGTDIHAQAACCFLSSAAPYDNEIKRSAYPLDRTFDHLVADHIGHQTPFSTLEFSCNSHTDSKESYYFDNISWYGTGHVAPSLRDPRKIYNRLFGTKGGGQNRHITDMVLADATNMRKELGRADQHKFEEYFDAIRTIEQRIARMEALRSELTKVEIDEPAAARLPRGEYIRLIGDLMIVALQTGLTNVATMMVGPERWDTPYMFDGVFEKPMSHHKMSHNQHKFTDELLKVDRFHMEQFAYLVGRMSNIVEANGTTLLDNTLFTYGSGLGDGATHQFSDLPIVTAGGKSIGMRTGKHLNCPDGTPLANLWLTQASALGVKTDRFADSTGTLDQLFS